MQFTKFGQTGLTVSRMILTGTFGKQTDEKEAHRMLDKAVRLRQGLTSSIPLTYVPRVRRGRWC